MPLIVEVRRISAQVTTGEIDGQVQQDSVSALGTTTSSLDCSHRIIAVTMPNKGNSDMCLRNHGDRFLVVVRQTEVRQTEIRQTEVRRPENLLPNGTRSSIFFARVVWLAAHGPVSPCIVPVMARMVFSIYVD